MKYNFDLEMINNNSLLLILQNIKSNSTVLEFGPANGRLTKYLDKELNCDVYLAELDEEAGREALQYGKELVVGDIENYEWYDKYKDIRFDYILFADVLEHLRNPKEVLAKSKLLLKQEGSFLLSVPNMAHNSVLIDLMKNELCYTDVGLLDNTHIHFFTYNSLERMIKECNLYPSKRMGTYCEVGKTEIINSVYDIERIGAEYWNTRKYGEVYQFVYELKKGKEYIEEELNILNPYYHHYWLQSYSDVGSGMNEELSSKYYFDINVKNHRFELPVDSECSTFRIDPLNTSCVLRINCISVRHEEAEEVIQEFSSNANRKFHDIYFFETEDPMIMIGTENMKSYNEAKIIIDFEIISYDKLCIDNMNDILNELSGILTEKEERIAKLEKTINELKDNMRILNREKEELQSVINHSGNNKKSKFSISKN